jgi:hypothetical protein
MKNKTQSSGKNSAEDEVGKVGDVREAVHVEPHGDHRHHQDAYVDRVPPRKKNRTRRNTRTLYPPIVIVY